MTTTSLPPRAARLRAGLTTLLPTRASRAAALVFAATTAVDLAAELAGAGTVARVAQACLMPALAATVALATARRAAQGEGRRLVRWSLAGLALSWLGDAAPGLAGENGFLVMVGFFLLAQVAYIVALAPYARRSPALRPVPLVAYAVLAAGVVAACAPAAGPLTGAVVGYAVALMTMSASAWGLNRTAGVGGLVFLASDTLIALDRFTAVGDHLPASGFWIMASYAVGQAMLAAGVLREVAAGATAQGDPAAPPSPPAPAPTRTA